MPTATKAGLDDKMTDTGILDGILAEWEKNVKDIKIPACFNKMPQETGKTFPHSKQVGNYLVGKMINKGSFAKVMEGLHIPTGEKVAIKVIDKRKAKQDSYVLKNMKREPRVHQMIKHPNVVQLYETLETDNSYYMVMELCLGGDLLDRICDKKRLAEWEVRRYIWQILSAVEHLHCQGIVHRDLKIENFLLDENNNIKIIDFGLSNTAKFSGLSQELLHTQCGSPAYAAPELLAHRKYGPKVDVWSIGVSMFAMLTGTLPFTVEPFNIKQLHQKILIGEISPIPSDISPGAVHFMQSLLEPDPAKRPEVKEAIKDKWLNEGFTKKILNTAPYENRLCPSDLNSVVLNYMTEFMEFSPSEVINILINNRPSPAMASYCLLLKKLLRYQKDLKNAQRENEIEKHSINPDKQLNKKSEIKIFQKAEMDSLENLRNYGNKAFPSLLTLAMPDVIQEDEIAITLENQENLSKAEADLICPIFYLVSKFAGKVSVRLGPPKSSSSSMPCEPIYKPLLDSQKNQNNFEDLTEAGIACLHEKSQSSFSNVQAMTSTSKMPTRSLMENRIITRSPLPCQDMRFKDLLKVVDENIYIPTQSQLNKDVTDLMIDSLPLPPFPRLRQATLRETLPRKISLLGSSQEHTNISPLVVVNGSKPSTFPMSQQQMFTIRSMKQLKENPTHFFNKKTKKNFIQLRHTPTTTDLNLPVLCPPYQTRLRKKAEILRLNFA
ncbi:hormonally up-regulated neu tumor-associated kinase homolog A-like [Corapipo altera]|uniref:hormonally up-regulated neu tumor-associated kinase homolog A-like n=1 Tax=Corapipo altera TaxID=415028 RepID=UPI000FD627AB|nr:hormonally up-regulated neu tumor-associated kinase homolog A-like [Corapipo altera]